MTFESCSLSSPRTILPLSLKKENMRFYLSTVFPPHGCCMQYARPPRGATTKHRTIIRFDVLHINATYLNKIILPSQTLA